MSKRDWGAVKSILHFDYPYYAEPGDGLGDEASSETWTRVGNTNLAGVEAPYDVQGAPKFGYRCAYFPDTSSSITGTNTSGIFDLSPSGDYEVCEVRRNSGKYIHFRGFGAGSECEQSINVVMSCMGN